MEAQAEIGRKVRAEDITEGKTYAEIRALSKEEARKAQRQAIINDWDWALDAAKERYNAFHEEQRLLSQLVEE